MPLSTFELAQAKEAADILLERLGLSAYLFEIEPRADHWTLRIDCAVSDGWQSLVLPVDKASLLASREEGPARARLLAEWQAHLAVCRTDTRPSA